MVESSRATEEHVAMVAMIGLGRSKGWGRQIAPTRFTKITEFHDFGTKFELDRIFSFFFHI